MKTQTAALALTLILSALCAIGCGEDAENPIDAPPVEMPDTPMPDTAPPEPDMDPEPVPEPEPEPEPIVPLVESPSHDFEAGLLEGCSGQIAWQRWSHNAGPAEATLVFVNGRTEYTDKYHHLLPLYGARPWNVVMFDHHGQGRSDGARGGVEDFEAQHACDMQAVIETLTEPELPLFVTAHSMGAMIALRWAQLHPEAANAMVISSGQLELLDSFCAVAAFKVESGESDETFTPSKPRPECAENSLTHDCELYEQFYQDPITEIGAPTWAWFDASCKVLDSIEADLGLLQTPIAVHAAGEDTVVTNPQNHEIWCASLNDLTPGLCSFTSWDGLFHELYMETERETILDDTLDFFDSHL